MPIFNRKFANSALKWHFCTLNDLHFWEPTPKKPPFFWCPHQMTPFFRRNLTPNAPYFRSPVGTCTSLSYLSAPRGNTTNAICNPWTASKSDRATKIIVTLLFNDGFQKIKNPLWKKVLFVSYQVTFIPEKNSRSRGPFFLTHPIFIIRYASCKLFWHIS